MQSPRSSRAAVRRLAASRLISLAGTDASAVAVSFSMYTATGSTAWLSLSLLVTFGLGSAIAPIAGAIADRHDRWRVMITADLVAAATFLVMAVEHSPVAILALSLVATSAGALHGAASGAAIPSLAGPDDLSWANGVLATAGNIGKTAGRLLGGVLTAAIGVGAVLALDALTFLVAALLVWSARPRERTAPARPHAGSRGLGIRAGWATLVADPRLRLVVGSSCLATFMTSFTMTAEVPLAVDFGVGAAGLGALAASWSVGMIAGSALAARTLHADSETPGLFAGRVLMGLGIASVAATPVFWPALASYAIGGCAGGFLLVAATSIMQRAAPEHVLGRVLATAEGLKSAAFGVGVLLAGLVVGGIGPQATFAVVGAGVVLSAVPVGRLLLLERRGDPMPGALAA